MAETLKEREARHAKRNLNPHAEAMLAMSWWSEDYAFRQRGGSMDFWDNLPDWKKQLCRDLVKRIQAAKTEEFSTPLVKAGSR